jgi:hypothetical protein
MDYQERKKSLSFVFFYSNEDLNGDNALVLMPNVLLLIERKHLYTEEVRKALLYRDGK